MNPLITIPELDRAVFLDPPELSIIIVSWNSSGELCECLRTLYTWVPSSLRFETVVVDNASTDDTAGVLKLKFPQVLFVQNRANVGFSAANNIGIRHARGKYLLLLNPDTIFVEDCVTPLLAKIKSDPSIGIIGCRLDNPDRTLQWSGDLFPIPMHEINLSFQSRRRKLIQQINEAVQQGTACEVGSLIGAFQLVPKDLLTRLGMMDERLFMYGEDLDLCYRVVRAGKKVIYDPQVTIVHVGGQSSSKVWNRSARLNRVRESIFLLHCKYFGALTASVSLFVRSLLGILVCGSALFRGVGRDGMNVCAAETAANWHVLFSVPAILAKRKARYR